MDTCVLTKPDTSWAEEIRSYRQEMLDAGSSIDGAVMLMRMENIADWLDLIGRLENEETVPDGFVPSDQFIYIRPSDNKIIGMIQVRRRLNDYLERYGGHIGYSVRPSERRMGCAKHMLADCLILCKAQGLNRVLITCRQDNEGSRRTILANGGVYESTVFCERDDEMLERYWIDL